MIEKNTQKEIAYDIYTYSENMNRNILEKKPERRIGSDFNKESECMNGFIP